jgi:hypothetical protein
MTPPHARGRPRDGEQPRAPTPLAARALALAILSLALGSALRVPSALALTAAEGDAATDLDRLMALLSQRQHGEADFTEKKYLSMLKQPLESSGVLIYQAPDHLEQRVTQPRPQSVVLDHGMLTMQIGQRRRVLRLEDYPQLAPLIGSIRATLAGDRAALERVFELQFRGTLEHWQLRLEPRDAQLAATLQRIELQGERDAVREVQIEQSDGDRSVMSITPRE